MTVVVPPHRSRRWSCPGPVLSLLAVLALTAGCSLALPPATPTAPGAGALTTPPAPAAEAPSAAVSHAPPSRAASADPAPVPIAGTDLARAASSIGDPGTMQLRFDILSLSRRGDLVELVARLTDVTPRRVDPQGDPLQLRWIIDGFSDGERKDLSGDGISRSFSDVTLIDGGAKKRYLVAADSGHRCVCTPNVGQSILEPGASLVLSATYAAPPVATTALDVDVPTVGLFRDVPIS